jgi:hypothetical protein
LSGAGLYLIVHLATKRRNDSRATACSGLNHAWMRNFDKAIHRRKIR